MIFLIRTHATPILIILACCKLSWRAVHFIQINMTYKDQIRHPYWQKKRLEILQRDSWKCIHCKTEINNLQVHHLYYTSGAMIWEYDNEALLTLCENCHEHYHDYLQKPIALLALKCVLGGLNLTELDEYLQFCIDYKKGLI